MNPSYEDIKAVAGEPAWYSENGVPRYAKEFHPTLCGVHSRYVAFIRIACQYCAREFLAATEIDIWTHAEIMPYKGRHDPHEAIGSFGYGDPPRHGCFGDMLASMPLEVLQFWKREHPGDWERDSSCEFAMPTIERSVEG